MKIYLVCANNGYSYEDYEWFILKAFTDEKAAEEYKANYKPEYDEERDFEPKVWVKELNVE